MKKLTSTQNSPRRKLPKPLLPHPLLHPRLPLPRLHLPELLLSTLRFPGSRCRKVEATQGSSVKKGDLLCVLEAMKMEYGILAPADGTVTAVYAKEGTSVNTGDVLFELA